jgi:hypothetical protein
VHEGLCGIVELKRAKRFRRVCRLSGVSH